MSDLQYFFLGVVTIPALLAITSGLLLAFSPSASTWSYCKQCEKLGWRDPHAGKHTVIGTWIRARLHGLMMRRRAHRVFWEAWYQGLNDDDYKALVATNRHKYGMVS